MKDGYVSKVYNVSIGILFLIVKKVLFYKNLFGEGKFLYVNLKSEIYFNYYMKFKLVYFNNVWVNVKSNISLYLKSGIGVDLFKIKFKDKFLVVNYNVICGKYVLWLIDVY